MTQFQYGSFYDVPRSILLAHHGGTFLLLSDFDDDLEEYPPDYTIYLLAETVEPGVADRTWSSIDDAPKRFLGQIPVSHIVFDPTKRKELDASFLDDLT